MKILIFSLLFLFPTSPLWATPPDTQTRQANHHVSPADLLKVKEEIGKKLLNRLMENTQSNRDYLKKRIKYFHNITLLTSLGSRPPAEGHRLLLTGQKGSLLLEETKINSDLSKSLTIDPKALKIINDVFKEAVSDIKLGRLGGLRSADGSIERAEDALKRLDVLYAVYNDHLRDSVPAEFKDDNFHKDLLLALTRDSQYFDYLDQLLKSHCDHRQSLLEEIRDFFKLNHLGPIDAFLAKEIEKMLAEIEQQYEQDSPSTASVNQVFFLKNKKENKTLVVQKPVKDVALFEEEEEFGVFNELFVSGFNLLHDNFFNVPLAAKTGDKTSIVFRDSKTFEERCGDEGQPESFEDCLKKIPKVEAQKYAALALVMKLDDAHCGNILLESSPDQQTYRPVSIDHGRALHNDPKHAVPRFTNCLVHFPGLDEEVAPEIKEFFLSLDPEKMTSTMREIFGDLGKEIHTEQFQEKIKHFQANLIFMKKAMENDLTLKETLALMVPTFKKDLDGKTPTIPRSSAGNLLSRKILLDDSPWMRSWKTAHGEEVQVTTPGHPVLPASILQALAQSSALSRSRSPGGSQKNPTSVSGNESSTSLQEEFNSMVIHDESPAPGSFVVHSGSGSHPGPKFSPSQLLRPSELTLPSQPAKDQGSKKEIDFQKLEKAVQEEIDRIKKIKVNEEIFTRENLYFYNQLYY